MQKLSSQRITYAYNLQFCMIHYTSRWRYNNIWAVIVPAVLHFTGTLVTKRSIDDPVVQKGQTCTAHGDTCRVKLFSRTSSV